MAYVYWIHHKDHTDMFTEGYIGVTTRQISKRFSDHLAIARNENSKDHSTVHKAINKYGLDLITVQCVVECSKEYAYYVEEKLRPVKGMAWNVAAGGENNTAGMISGRKLSAAHVRRLIEVNSNPTDETRLRKRLGQKRRYSEKDSTTLWAPELEYHKKLRKVKEVVDSFWRNPKITARGLHKIHAKAEDIYDFYYSNSENVQINAGIALFGLLETDRGAVGKLFQRFRSGWNPYKDQKWQEDFHGDFFINNGYLESTNKSHVGNIPDYYLKKKIEYESFINKESDGT